MSTAPIPDDDDDDDDDDLMTMMMMMAMTTQFSEANCKADNGEQVE